MKSKVLLIVMTAITLLSFTIISVNKTVKAHSKVEQTHKGFALQDSNQF
jgi:hypothetical protein